MNDSIKLPEKLWNQDFSLLVIGKIISIFGNIILSWTLPLFILDVSGSATLFGIVLAVPNISLLLMSPIGGVIADRFRKQWIMFWLDISVVFIVILYMAITSFHIEIVPVVIIKLLFINAIQAVYMPAVQASIPVLSPSDKLVPANGIISIINSFANMSAPAIAGILYGSFGLFPILVTSVFCFTISSIIDLFIRIPFKKQENLGSVAQIIKSDIKDSIHFTIKEKPIIFKCAIVLFFFSMTIGAFLLVGIPVLITQNLNLEMHMVGVSQSVMMIGGLIGGISAGFLGNKLTIKTFYLSIIFCSLAIIPIGIVLLFDLPVIISFVIITIAGMFTFIGVQICNIQIMSFIQSETPIEIVGKVLSILVVLPFLANAIGQLLFGFLFEIFSSLSWLIIFLASFISILVSIFSRKYFKSV
ncbi:MAG: MFS transporter [Defluviitaleaceae bacterium]|nr:MFS transporter [Defluviitaleaceae bacterium]